ncbi:uncharacterized protein BXZ73DRAFT_106009 [Epithele typhae]|uniref:uncharacterized protein n=1 Tax=Epithele typhae TaxID=378194 RepID=UPI0020078CD0|nr:uncharacterized protein BXZ73DRAFT_106009 [Epithele typhae]KAH9915943.1 hypothetical protein BXZ73DRAFT_106009 [Epithele typhae]
MRVSLISPRNPDILHNHLVDVHPALYCPSPNCKRLFDSSSNFNAHRRSRTHRPANVPCPMVACHSCFVDCSGVTVHLELSERHGHTDRHTLNRLLFALDRLGVATSVTTPSRGEEADVVSVGNGYECSLCRHKFSTYLSAVIHVHVEDASHTEFLYQCPSPRGCGKKFQKFSGLVGHVESFACAFSDFKPELVEMIEKVPSTLRRTSL